MQVHTVLKLSKRGLDSSKFDFLGGVIDDTNRRGHLSAGPDKLARAFLASTYAILSGYLSGTAASAIAGGWVYPLLCRRPLFAFLSDLFVFSTNRNEFGPLGE